MIVVQGHVPSTISDLVEVPVETDLNGNLPVSYQRQLPTAVSWGLVSMNTLKVVAPRVRNVT